MKKINEAQTKAILDLLVKYNVGVQEYGAVQKMFQELPVVEVPKEEVTTNPATE